MVLGFETLSFEFCKLKLRGQTLTYPRSGVKRRSRFAVWSSPRHVCSTKSLWDWGACTRCYNVRTCTYFHARPCAHECVCSLCLCVCCSSCLCSSRSSGHSCCPSTGNCVLARFLHGPYRARYNTSWCEPDAHASEGVWVFYCTDGNTTSDGTVISKWRYKHITCWDACSCIVRPYVEYPFYDYRGQGEVGG